MDRVKLHFGIKVAVSLVLLRLVFAKIPFSDLIPLLKNISFPHLLISVLVYIGAIIVSGKKWHALISRQEKPIAVVKLMQLSYIGLFFQTILPGGQLTGEATKLLYAKKYLSNHTTEEITLSIVTDKIFSLLAFVALGVVAILVSQSVIVHRDYIREGLATALVLGTLGIYLSISFEKVWRDRAPAWLVPIKVLGDFLKKVMEDRKRASLVIFYSLLFQILNTYSVWFIARAVQAPITITDLLWIYPTVSIFLLIPGTFLGIGQREIGFIYLTGLVGIEASRATAVSLALFTVLILTTLVGGIASLILLEREVGDTRA